MSSPDVDISASQFSNHGGGEHFGISEKKIRRAYNRGNRATQEKGVLLVLKPLLCKKSETAVF